MSGHNLMRIEAVSCKRSVRDMTRVRTCEEGVDALRLGREAAQVAQVGHQQRQRLLDAVERETDLRQQLTRFVPTACFVRQGQSAKLLEGWCRRRQERSVPGCKAEHMSSAR